MVSEILQWDSDFFGFKVAKFEIESRDTKTDIINKVKSFKNVGVKLIYVFTQLHIKLPIGLNEILVDTKTTFVKSIPSSFKPTPLKKGYTILPYNNIVSLEKLIGLGLQSGVYSRFNTDVNMPKGTFDKLYTLWIKNSVDKLIAEQVFVAYYNNVAIGIITLGLKNGTPDIGILAVDSSSRGTGIGKQLVAHAEKYFSTNFKNIQVVTQWQNQAACNFYLNCGFNIKNKVDIYHIWL